MRFKFKFKYSNLPPRSGLQDHVKEKARLLAAGCNLAQLGFHLQVGPFTLLDLGGRWGDKLFRFYVSPSRAATWLSSASICRVQPSRSNPVWAHCASGRGGCASLAPSVMSMPGPKSYHCLISSRCVQSVPLGACVCGDGGMGPCFLITPPHTYFCLLHRS